MATSIPNGYTSIFRQSWAPVKWTKVTTNDDYALRVTSTVGADGGTTGFSTVFNETKTASGSFTISGTIGPGIGGVAFHNHSVNAGTMSATVSPALSGPLSGVSAITNSGSTSGSTGGGVPHTHTFTNTTVAVPNILNKSININYIDIILATRTG
jgi:hypothetical protein